MLSSERPKKQKNTGVTKIPQIYAKKRSFFMFYSYLALGGNISALRSIFSHLWEFSFDIEIQHSIEKRCLT